MDFGTANCYLLSFSIRFATMIDEPWDISLHRSINYLIRLQSHKIIMLILIFRIFFCSSTEIFRVHHFADIFHHETSTETSNFWLSIKKIKLLNRFLWQKLYLYLRFKITGCSKSETFFLCPEHFALCIFAILESFICTSSTNITSWSTVENILT